MNLSNLLHSAESAHKSGDYILAEKQYSCAIKNFNSNDATYGLATLYFQKKSFDLAIPLFEQAAKKEPFAYDIALNFAFCLNAAQQNNKALEIINSIKHHLPNDAHVIISFANLALSIGHPDVSIQILQSLKATCIQSQQLFATAYMKLEDWGSAKAYWQELSNKAPSVPLYWEKLAFCAGKRREYTQAIDAFTTYISLSNKNSDNHLKFADLYILSRDIKDARIQLDIAIELGDVSLTRYDLEARICRLENNIKQAIISADKVIELNPISHIAWAIKQELGKQYDQCISKLTKNYNSKITNTYESQHNLFTLAKAYEKTEQYKLAFEYFTKANQLQLEQQKLNNAEYNKKTVIEEHSDYKKIVIQAKLKKLNQPQNQPQNIFIVGMPRSGTTLMDRLISQHPEIQSCGENEALAFSIDKKIKQHSEFKHINWQAFFSKNTTYFREYYQQETALNTETIVDKMPHNFRYVGAMVAIIKDVKIIQMRRSPEDLALSIYSHPFALHHNYAAKLESIAHTIYYANKLMDYWANLYPDNVIDVNYEQLAKTPSTTSAEIYKFCNLQWHDDYLNFHQKAVSSFTFSELQVRKPINTSKINFSRHYDDQFKVFRETYRQLIQDNC